jgi:hypothetical protein
MKQQQRPASTCALVVNLRSVNQNKRLVDVGMHFFHCPGRLKKCREIAALEWSSRLAPLSMLQEG